MHKIFADTPETRAWLDAIAAVPEDEKNLIQIPDQETWQRWLQYVEVPNEDLVHVIETTPSPDSNPELFDILQRGAAHLIASMGQITSPTIFAALADINHPHYRYFYVQLLTACLPFVREYHQALGIPETITQATVADLGRNICVHRKREGVGGLGVMWWLMLHFRGVIFQLGRLQFELQQAGDEVSASMREHGLDADSATNVLSVHIPDFMGPMGYDACSESIDRAVQFFPTYFPEWPVNYVVCNSWLLDPQLKDVLKPTSNIIRFQDRFTIAEGTYDSSNSVMQFVFGKQLRDIDSIHPQSSLERGIISHLKNGKDWHGRQGWFALPAPSSR